MAELEKTGEERMVLEKNKEEERMVIFSQNTALTEESLVGDTLDRIYEKKREEKKTKNLVSIIILLAGLFAGSLFVDFIQLFSGSGYSERALKEAEIFEDGNKTWVAFTDPAVELKVLNANDEDLKNCPDCDPKEVLLWIKKFLPTLVIKKVEIDSAEGEKLKKDLDIINLPAFIFNDKIKKTDFYSQEGVKSVFEEKNGLLILNKTMMGIPAGRYLKFPEITAEEKIWGNDQGLKIIAFVDFQCPYSKKLFASLQELFKEGYQDKIGVVLKNLPETDLYPLAKDASKMVFCAGKQDKFWQAAQLLFDKQDQWSKAKSESVFATYYPLLKLDQIKMKDCLAGQEVQAKIDSDKKQAENFSLAGTPSGFIGNELFGGALEKDELKNMIEKQLQTK